VPKGDDFAATFKTLRALLTPYERHFAMIADQPGRDSLFHLVPVDAAPARRETLSPSLRRRMQRKSCFNFAAIDPAHVAELEALPKKGFDGFIKTYR
jgi:hypothetical protein